MYIFLWFVYRYGDSAQQGLEAKSWNDLSSLALNFAKYGALYLTTMYLPVFQETMRVLACDIDFVSLESDSCYTEGHMGLVILAVVHLLLFLIPLPFYLIYLINNYKPRISLYDAEGKLREGDSAYTDTDYQQDLAKDVNPYKSLYSPYERKWACFKVIVLGLKVCLAAPAILLVPSNVIGGRTTSSMSSSSSSSLDEDGELSSLIMYQSLIGLIVMGVYLVLTYSNTIHKCRIQLLIDFCFVLYVVDNS